MVADLNGGYVSECVGCWWKLDFCRGGKPYFEIMSTRVLGNHSNHYKLGCQSLVLMPVIVLTPNQTKAILGGLSTASSMAVYRYR